MQLIAAPSVFLFARLLLVGAEARQSTGSPVEKVVKLLEEMEADLKSDQAKEQQTYDKYACWCEETTDRKATAIDQARKDLRSLGQEIVIQRGIVAQKTTEIEETTKDIKANEESQAEATSIRQKENEAYMTEQAEMQQAINALQRAVTVLGDAQKDATGFLQQGASAQLGRQLQAAREALAAAPSRALERFARQAGSGSASKLALIGSYAQQLAKGQARYTPQSATITGILKDIYETFAEDLESMSGEEADKNRDFEDLIATKQEELEKLQKKLKDVEKAKAEAELMEAEAAQAYDDTEEQLKADVEFFDATKTACTDKSKAWKERKQIREDEIEAVGKALEVLGSDDARELFGKASNQPGVQQASLLQMGNAQNLAASSTAEPARKAYQIVKGLASGAKSLRLARLAASVHSAKAGHFEEVISSIDTLIGELREEAKMDAEKRDQCKEEYLKVESKTKDLKWKITNNGAAIGKLENKIEKLGKEKTATLKQIGETEKAIEDLNSTRQEENDEYKEAKKDDEDAIKLLKEAKTFLADFYKKNEVDAALLQSADEPEFERSADDAPEAEFSGKGKRKGQAKGVLALLSHIIEDLHGELAVSKKAEEAAQLEYEKQLKAAQELVATLEARKVSLEGSIADREQERDDEKQDKEDNEKDLEDEEKHKEDIEPDCDFMIKNFEERAAKRTAEIDGLNQAKDYLAGYQPPAEEALLLQGRADAPRRPFDDAALARISFHGIA